METFELDQATLTQQASAMLVGRPLADTPLGPATVRELSIQLDEGRAFVTGQVQAGFMTLPMSMTAAVDVDGGRPIVRVQAFAIGGFGLPDTVRQGVESRIQAEVDQAMTQQNARVDAVTIRPGTMTVSGHPA